MKLTKAVLASLNEGIYTVKITSVDFVPKTEQNKDKPEMRRVNFVVLKEEVNENGEPVFTPTERTGNIIIWPKNAEYLYKHLANKANIEVLEDDEQLVNKQIELAFAHSYIDPDTKTRVYQEQWKLYN